MSVVGTTVLQSPPGSSSAPGSGSRFPAARVPSGAGIVAGGAVLAACVLLIAVGDALPVFILGLLLAFVLDPVVTWLAAHRLPRGLAALLAMSLLAVVVGAIAILFLDTVATQAAAFVAMLPGAFDQLAQWVATLGLPAGVQEDLLAWLASAEQAALDVDVTTLLAPIVEGLFAALGAFFTLLTLPFFMFYVLAGRPTIGRLFREILPVPWRDDVLTVLAIVLNSFGTYVRAEAIVMCILGAMTWVGIMLLSVIVDPAFAEFALILAIIAAFSELIPNYGPWIAAIPAVLISLTISPVAVVATIVLYIILMFIEGQVLVPKIEGGAFSFHPALVLFLVVAGVSLMGILGAILALPVTAAAWRSTRYAFRRASGRTREEALAYDTDELEDTGDLVERPVAAGLAAAAPLPAAAGEDTVR